MSRYKISSQNYLIRLQEKNIKKCWDQLQLELKEKTLELETWALKPKEGHFYARGVSDRIFIEGKGIKGIRTISFPEFEKAGKYYDDYLNGIPGIKQRMRDDIGYNTSYILTLLNHALETAPPIPTEPKPRKKVEDSPKHYRIQRRRM